MKWVETTQPPRACSAVAKGAIREHHFGRLPHSDFGAIEFKGWISNFSISNPVNDQNVNNLMEIEFTVDIGDETYFFECGCFVVRVEPDNKSIAGVFVDMNPSDRQAVVQYFEDR